jgi:hypothetical protein
MGMRAIVDLTGRRFGSLVVLRRGARLYEYSTNACWLVRCDCGTEKTIYGPSLKQGNARSCGTGQCHCKSKKNSNREQASGTQA